MEKINVSRIGVITHPGASREFVEGIIRKLKEEKVTIYLDPVTADKTGSRKTEIKDMKIDAALILGGDGTLLWSTNELDSNVLLLGINTGSVGYLTELKKEDAIEGISKLLAGDFFIDERTKLIVDNNYEALNEVVILPEMPASLLEFRIRLNQEVVAEFRADGVLVSTQTGSTGHSLSLGGPIIHPEARVYLLSPIIPFMQEQPSLILPDDSKIEIEILRENRDANIISDGNVIKKIKPNTRILIEKSGNKARFIRFSKDVKWKTRKPNSWN